jgi:hypothetical protein
MGAVSRHVKERGEACVEMPIPKVPMQKLRTEGPVAG